MEYRLIRTLSCYSKNDEHLVFDVQLQGFDLSKFQKEFCVSNDNPMYDCFPVSVKNIAFLKSYLPPNVGIDWDFNHYSYMVEAIEN